MTFPAFFLHFLQEHDDPQTIDIAGVRICRGIFGVSDDFSIYLEFL